MKRGKSPGSDIGVDFLWRSTPRRQGAPDRQLKPLLRAFYIEAVRRPPDTSALALALRPLFQFLCGPGRTAANTWFVDLFLNQDDGWEADWGELPEPLHDIV